MPNPSARTTTGLYIEELLAQFDANAHALKHPFAFRLAILFHDAIYDPARVRQRGTQRVAA